MVKYIIIDDESRIGISDGGSIPPISTKQQGNFGSLPMGMSGFRRGSVKTIRDDRVCSLKRLKQINVANDNYADEGVLMAA